MQIYEIRASMLLHKCNGLSTPKSVWNSISRLAKNLGIKMRVNFELDVGLHRGGFANADASSKALGTTLANPTHLEFAGFMGYEPHLAGVADTYDHPAMRKVLQIYAAQIDQIKQHGLDPAALTINGAG
jgi:D-serine deaminase-like pyridoxal phosphate-dependent protein